MKKIFNFLLLFLLYGLSVRGQELSTVNVDGLQREFILIKPQKQQALLPVVFVFHGHGGNAKYAVKRLNFHDNFKEAIVIYMQGIPGTQISLIDPQGKFNGWQNNIGENNDRDIHFFDAVLDNIAKKYPIDPKKVYLVGHSNGARFANVLWKMRGQKLAAICSASAQGGIMIQNSSPISIWMIMGKNDPIVPFRFQQNSIPIVAKNLGVDLNAGNNKNDITVYKAKNGCEMVVQIREAGHEFPQESIPDIVDFFKRNPKR